MSVALSCRETQKSKRVHSCVHTVVSDTSCDSCLMKRWPFALGLVAVLCLVKPWWSASAGTSELWPCGRGIKCWRHSESSRSGDKSGRRIAGWRDGCLRIKDSLIILLSHSVTSSILSPAALYDILWSFFKKGAVFVSTCGVNLGLVHAEYP